MGKQVVIGVAVAAVLVVCIATVYMSSAPMNAETDVTLQSDSKVEAGQSEQAQREEQDQQAEQVQITTIVSTPASQVPTDAPINNDKEKEKEETDNTPIKSHPKPNESTDQQLTELEKELEQEEEVIEEVQQELEEDKVMHAVPPPNPDKTTAPFIIPPLKEASWSGPAAALQEDFVMILDDNAPQPLKKALRRYEELWKRRFVTSDKPKDYEHMHKLKRFKLVSSTTNDQVNIDTDYSYTVHCNVDSLSEVTCTLSGKSCFGVIYAMETVSQLLFQGGNTMLMHSTISITDAPAYRWRGLLLDSGRRFLKVSILKSIMDTMVAAKLNVLHWHLTDHCRFALASDSYPALTNSLKGSYAGHYVKQDVATVIEYAAERGIRVVPEFDIPGHSRGYMPIEGQIHFCDKSQTRTQLFNDPKGETMNVVKTLLHELLPLFKDEVVHLGCDETKTTGQCTHDSTFRMEKEVVKYVKDTLGKTTAGWEEMHFVSKAATPETIVYIWSTIGRHTPSEITQTGRRVVQCSEARFYFTQPAPGGPAGWKKSWTDISQGIPETQKHLLLGGQMSMWTDNYIPKIQCGSWIPKKPHLPPGHKLFPPEQDDAFEKSLGGMIWPRGFVAASSFWNFDTKYQADGPVFTAAVWRLNDDVASRGGHVCPTKCSCTVTSACNKDYM
eukprot:m.10095 g.10095  ORF g.10095 m.10095 type:complete len:670 (+) comp5526_c0_seq1:31-2040(+)